MVSSGITKDTYVCLTTARYGYAAGLIGVVHAVGTDWSGAWYFQLRWLNQPAGKRNQAVSAWSLNLHEHDLEYFERMTWEQVQELLKASRPPSTLRKALWLPGAWRGKRDPNQVRLFDDC